MISSNAEQCTLQVMQMLLYTLNNCQQTRNWGRPRKGSRERERREAKLILSPSLPPLCTHHFRSKSETSGNEAVNHAELGTNQS